MSIRSPAITACGMIPRSFLAAIVFLGGLGFQSLAFGEHDGPGGTPEIHMRLPQIRALPGDMVRVPIVIQSGFPVAMAAFSIEYDTAVLDLALPRLSDDVQRLLERLGGHNSHMEWFVNEDEGWFQFALVMDFDGRVPFALPAGTIPLISLGFKVLDAARPGEYPLRFTRKEAAAYTGNFADGQYQIYNSVRRPGSTFTRESRFRRGEAEDPQLEDGLFIIGDVGVFSRGDANIDRSVDIADSVTILLYLFGGGRRLDCEDAADANDDGNIDISDPVTILGYLFLGAETPTITPGVLVRDETPDDLGCFTY